MVRQSASQRASLPARPFRPPVIHSPLISVSGGKLPIPLSLSLCRFFPIQSNSNRLISPRPSAVRRTRLVSRLGLEPTHAAAAAATTYLSIPLARLILSLSLCSSRPVSVVGQKSVWASCVLISRYIGAIISQRQRPTDRPTHFLVVRGRVFYAHSSSKRENRSSTVAAPDGWMDGWCASLSPSSLPSLCASLLWIKSAKNPARSLSSPPPPLHCPPPRGAGMDVAVFILETV